MVNRRLTTRVELVELEQLAQITDEDRVLAQLAWRERAPTLKLILDAEEVPWTTS